MSDIFLSYEHDNRDEARKLAQALEAQGWSVWWDRRIPAGRTFDEVIEEAIDASRSVIVLWSSKSVSSRWVRTEAEEGAARNILVPVLIEKVKIPLAFRRIHAADLTAWNGKDSEPSFQRLTGDLAALLGPTSKKKQPPSKRKKSRQPAATASELTPGTVKQNPKDGLDYVWIPPGTFEMGCVPGDDECQDDEIRHSVTISKGLWIGRTTVSVAAYKRFVKAKGLEMPPPPDFNPSWKHQDHPIVSATWKDAVAYCKWVGGRLPTEAEWEYAARGGKGGTKYPWGNQIRPKNATYGGKGTTPVAHYSANGWGLYDVSGNVWEWNADWYGKNYYKDSPGADPPGMKSGKYRVVRGGSWVAYPRHLRLSCRMWDEPGVGSRHVGFRCVGDVEREASSFLW